jgi:hypothetical protein
VVQARYEQQLTARLDAAKHLASLERRWLILRGVLFFAAAGLLIAGYTSPPPSWPLLLPGWLCVAAFVASVGWHESYQRRHESLQCEARLYQRLLHRLQRKWDQLPTGEPQEDLPASASKANANPSACTDPDRVSMARHPTSIDLDLFGRGSLFQFVNVGSTAPGQQTLAKWFSEFASPEAIQQRHAAIDSLASEVTWRESFLVESSQVGQGVASPDRFLRWLRQPPWLAQRPWLRWWSLALLGIWPVVAICLWQGWLLSPMAALGIVASIAAINLLITTGWGGAIHDIFLTACGRAGEVARYDRLFSGFRHLTATGPWLDELRHATTDSDQGATVGLKRLVRMSVGLMLWRIPIMFLIYLPLQVLFLWDVHMLAWLERWQQRFSSAAPKWFDALGQLEALMSLATLRHDYPQWCWPTLDLGPNPRWVAQGLGHPLLGDDKRVLNDVALGPAGTTLLITGSNMSGKSTTLRAIGLNTVLAGAGGPCCATTICLPPLRLATSIRVRDSLHDGVSFYMAELQRLRQVVQQARQTPANHHTLYLLDEILQGTNSAERQVAVVQVLQHLLHCPAIGAMTTHDLELADHPGLATAEVVHFREQFSRDPAGKPQMSFDYKMKKGVCPTTNALKLLEIVGLADPPSASQGPTD